MIDAQDWYENEASGLGRNFRAAVDAVIQRMSANPWQFPVVYKSIRRALLRHFPYALMFVIEADETLFLAHANMRTHSRTWETLAAAARSRYPTLTVANSAGS